MHNVFSVIVSQDATIFACYSFRYIYPVSSDGETQTMNPEVRSMGPRPTIVRDQVFALTTITNRLKLAFNGQDVDWIDTGNYLMIINSML